MSLYFPEILELAEKADDLAAMLKKHYSPQLASLLKYAFDPNIKFRINAVSYKADPAPYGYAFTSLYREIRKLSYLVDRPTNTLTDNQIRNIATTICEGVHEPEAQLVIAVLNKTVPQNISADDVLRAFPGLFELEVADERDD